MQTLANAIRTYQKARGIITTRALAAAIGVSPPTLYDALAGRRVPNVRTVGLYAKALKTAPDLIMQMAHS